MANDGYIQVPSDGAGKKVDTSQIPQADTTVRERQRTVIGDDLSFGELASVEQQQLVVKELDIRELLFEVVLLLTSIDQKLG